MHFLSHFASQQTPSAQMPLAHCLSQRQVEEFGRAAVETVEQSTLVASLLSDVPSRGPPSEAGPDDPFLQPDVVTARPIARTTVTSAAKSRARFPVGLGALPGRKLGEFNCSNRR